MADGLLNKASIILTPTGYKAGTLYNVAPVVEPYEDFDFARTSTATRINSSGLVSNVATGVPRISYDSNGDNGHILLEPTSTNLITYSEDFTQGWSDFNVGFTSGFNSPDGTNNATLLSGNGISSFPNIKDTLSSSGDVSFSVFVKKELSDTIALRVEGTGIGVGLGTNSIYTYTFSTNSFSNVSGEDASGFDSEPLSNDWIRLQINYTSTTITACRIYPAYNVANSEGVYIWGAQLEELPYATSYIPTLTGSQEVRATETATGAGNSTLINSTEGVLYAEIAALANDGTIRILSISDSSSSNRVALEYKSEGNLIRARVRSNGSNAGILGDHSINVGQFYKFALKWKANDFAFWIDGEEVATDTSGNAPIGLNTLNFNNSSTQPFYGKCKALAVFNEALSDSELTQLTT